MIDQLLTNGQAAELLSLSPRTLEKMRLTGDGPPFIKLGRHRAVRYRESDLQAWIEGRIRKSTSDPGPAAA